MRDNLSQRPKIYIPRTGWDYVAEVLALTGVVLIVLLPLLIWSDLPERVPRHFGLTGDTDAWAGRWSIILPSVIAIVVYVGLTLLARVPHHFNYPWPVTEQNAAVMYRLGRSMVIWLKTLIVWSQARVALGEAERIHPLAVAFFLVSIHAVVGVFVYRTYRHRDGRATRPAGAGDSH